MKSRATVEYSNRQGKPEVVKFDWNKIPVTCNTKYLSTAEAAQREGILPRALQKRFQADAKRPLDKRRYPGAYRCQCGHGWFVPDGEVKND